MNGGVDSLNEINSRLDALVLEEEILSRFTPNLTPDGEMKTSLKEMNNIGATVTRMISDRVPPGRYQALALTAIEEAIMWANKGITHQ